MDIDANKVIDKLKDQLSDAMLKVSILQVQVEQLAAELSKPPPKPAEPAEQLELDIEDD